MPKKKIIHLDVKPGYDLYAPFYDEKTAYLNGFEQNQLLPLFAEINGKRVLDAGAGTGRFTVKLARLGAEVTALDISEEILKVLKKKNNQIAAVIGDVEQLPFPDNNFDIVLGLFLIVHLKQPAVFFQEAYRVLKPDGQLIITNINQKKPPELKTRNGLITIESYYHRPEKVAEKMEKAGFVILRNIFVKEKERWINQIVVGGK